MTYVHMHVGMEEKKRTKTRIRMEGIRITHSCISPHVRNVGNILSPMGHTYLCLVVEYRNEIIQIP